MTPNRHLAALAAALLVPFALAQQEAPAPPDDANPEVAGDPVSALVAADPRLSTLATLLEEAGLLDTLAEPGPLTLFAPTDEAFAALSDEELAALTEPPERLTEVLAYHLANGVLLADDLRDTDSVPTRQGSALVVSRQEDGTLALDGAGIVEADVAAGNGVIQVIDRVLAPPTVDTAP